MTEPLLQVRDLVRSYAAGDETLTVLKSINLDIAAGEMVAIVGASGSGKSTLMNILGCLDRPNSGSYCVAGRDTRFMTQDELAELRREHFGFIFQRYHLLGDLDAKGNVEVPAVYAGESRTDRGDRACELLGRLGLGDRIHHRPGQLSGGQQQRVSIARALINGGQVILADEPTGALDSRSGEEVMRILSELHAQGHTIIIVTHDMSVAQHAQRIIELRDGEIISDGPSQGHVPVEASSSKPLRDNRANLANPLQYFLNGFVEAFHMALLAMSAHRMRTLLTMLGIIIGIASVVLVVALGKGSQEQVLSNISAMGTNTIDVYPGTGYGDMRSGRVQTLRPGDADALAAQSFIDSVTPNVSSNVTARVGNKAFTVKVNGVGDQFFRVKGINVDQGALFDQDAVDRLDRTVVIDPSTRDQLFPNGENPIGRTVFLGQVPCVVIGVTQKLPGAFGSSSELRIWAPYTTVMHRMLGQSYLSGITIRVDDETPVAAAEQAVTKVLLLRHGTQDFFFNNSTEIRETIEKTTQTMTLMIGSIAMISLIVGGIGVMNIMLVSVTERTREIGVRMAVGARQRDIMQQFLIEAIMVCMLGGVLGVLTALGAGSLISALSTDFQLSFSTWSIVSAFLCASLIGVAFGFLPARSAARLDPVEALARE